MNHCTFLELFIYLKKFVNRWLIYNPYSFKTFNPPAISYQSIATKHIMWSYVIMTVNLKSKITILFVYSILNRTPVLYNIGVIYCWRKIPALVAALQITTSFSELITFAVFQLVGILKCLSLWALKKSLRNDL